jgi:broad specificity phosphatase PhoE
MALITLLRHAPLAFKHQKRYVGHSDMNIDLSLIDTSNLDIIKNHRYDYIYSSDLKRCTQTLDLIKFTYIKDSRLREVKFKDKFELKNFSEIEKFNCFNYKYLTSLKSWHEYICEENFLSFENRVKSFIKVLPKDKNILICSHAGTIKMLYSILKQQNYEKSNIELSYLDTLNVVI